MSATPNLPRVVDNDEDEITVTLNGKELRGWSYRDEAERRVKMLAAREFVEGWFQAANTSSEAVDLLVAEMPDEDDIEEAISGSIDIDWTPRDAAREVMRLLAKGVNKTGRNGELLERCCPNDPDSDPKNKNIQPVLKALTDLELYLRDTPHHNAPQAAAARAAIAEFNIADGDTFYALREAFLRGASWRKRNGFSEGEAEEYIEKAATDYADVKSHG